MQLTQYLKQGISPYHVVKTSKEWLEQEGFSELSMDEKWQLKEGQGYYVSPYESSLFAFRAGQGPVRIATGHTDQPMLKVKPNPSMVKENCYVINVESYGGMILHTWFDRPLALAGKVVCRSEEVFVPNVMLYDSQEPVAIVPSLAIHYDREVNKKNELKTQIHLLPLAGLQRDEQQGDVLLSYIAKQMDVLEDDILDYDLFFYNPQEPRLVGLEQELLVSPRLDNLTSCYSAVQGLIKSPVGKTNIIALFDHEEIGSRSKQGASSNLFSWFLNKCINSLNQSGITVEQTLDSLISNGFILSLDVAHACHPNYSDKSDPTTKTRLGEGVVLKLSGSQKYNSDSVSNAIFMQLCEREQIQCQRQINHSDIVGGSTLGPIVSSFVPIPGVDVGVPVLAMHSAVETAAYQDCIELNRLVTAFFS